MDYSLLDSGEGRKLENFGGVLLDRPEVQAIWAKGNESLWAKADAVFEVPGGWKLNRNLPGPWQVHVGNFAVFETSLKSFKHTGVFPEQISNWEWIRKQVESSQYKVARKEKIKVLNLFGYTGGATVAAAKAGAEVTHVDSSKPSVTSASNNAKLNGLESAKIRWIVDDATAFVNKEIKRGNKYDAIILDPPSFGRGTKGEVWKIENDLLPLLIMCKKILFPKPTFILLNGYASPYTRKTYAQLLQSVFGFSESEIESGELGVVEQGDRAFVLPSGIYARWSSK